jgi:hypothetical protein
MDWVNRFIRTKAFILSVSATIIGLGIIFTAIDKGKCWAEQKLDSHIVKLSSHVSDSIVDTVVTPVISIVMDQTLTQAKTDLALEIMMSDRQKAIHRARWWRDSIEMEKRFRALRLKK